MVAYEGRTQKLQAGALTEGADADSVLAAAEVEEQEEHASVEVSAVSVVVAGMAKAADVGEWSENSQFVVLNGDVTGVMRCVLCLLYHLRSRICFHPVVFMLMLLMHSLCLIP